MNGTAIGNRLKTLRGDKRLEEIAYKVGCSVSSVVLYESGKRIPKDDVKIKLANLYGLTVQELFFSEQKEKDIQS